MFNGTNVTDVGSNGTCFGDFGQSLIVSLASSFPLMGMFFGSGSSDGSTAGGHRGAASSLFFTGVLLLVSNYLMVYLTQYLAYLYGWIQGKFVFSMTISSDDEIYRWIFHYIDKSQCSRNSSNISAHSGWNTNNTEDVYSVNTGKKRPSMFFIPYYGCHYFKVNGYPVFITRQKEEKQGGGSSGGHYRYYQSKKNYGIDSELYILSTFGFFPQRTMKFLKDFVADCMEDYYAKTESKTYLYTPITYEGCWKRTSEKNVRSFDSVVLEEGLKEEIEKDVRQFQSSKSWYGSRGIPWRRGYILHGPPGTGKTSFISALAGKLGLSIAILSLNSGLMDDSKLSELMDSAPRNSILVIEDVDVAIAKKRIQKDGGEGGGNNNNNNNNNEDRSGGGPTLSGLLNALDGIGTAEGRILFMTTNHIDTLSMALLRPGRCDLKKEFGFASHHQIEQLWEHFYLNKKGLKNEQEKEEHEMKIRGIGKILKERIPDRYVSCAELQGLFLLHRYNEEGVVDDLDRFLEEIRKTREKSKDEKKNKKEEKKE